MIRLRYPVLLIVISSSLLLMPQKLRAAANDDFLSVLALLPKRSVFYGCELEVSSEWIDGDCAERCRRRLFLRIMRPDISDAFISEIYSYSANVPVLPMTKFRYAAVVRSLDQVPTVYGALQVAKDGRLLSLRFDFHWRQRSKHVFCRGLTPRQLEPMHER